MQRTCQRRLLARHPAPTRIAKAALPGIRGRRARIRHTRRIHAVPAALFDALLMAQLEMRREKLLVRRQASQVDLRLVEL